MRLAITGGGTGGHVFPALEVARVAKRAGAEVLYLGSRRGQEARLAEQAGIRFVALPTQPLVRPVSLRGLTSLISFLRARVIAKPALRNFKPDALFSTGGYSAAPVVSAGIGLDIPLVIHEQNAMPGRTNLLFARKAQAVGITFRSSEEHFEGCKVIRTGFPVRKELRDLASGPRAKDLLPNILVVGGSQGAQAINEAALGAGQRMVKRALHWTHVAGKSHFEAVFDTYEKLALKDEYEVKSYLEGSAMAEAYARATIVVGRAGAGTLSELAAFGLPSVLIPYPYAQANHQHHNAAEFSKIGAATLLNQRALSPSTLESALAEWLDDTGCRELAAKALKEWDVPDAADRLFAMIKQAADVGPM